MNDEATPPPDGTAEVPGPTPAPAPAVPASDGRRGAELRRGLLARLPQLAVRATGSDRWFGLDEVGELRAVLDQDPDALLEPLEAAARETNGS